MDSLIDLQETYESYLDAIPTGILVVNEWFMMEFVNEPMLQMTGYTRKQLIHEHISMLMPKRDVAIHREHERDFDRNPRSRIGNHGLKPIIVTKKKQEIAVDITLSTMNIRGERFHMANIRTLASLYESLGHTPR